MSDEILNKDADQVIHEPEIAGTSNRKRQAAIWGGIVFLGIVCVLGVWVYNQTVLQKPLERVLAGDPRNRVVNASAHFDWLIDTDTVVFNLLKIDDNATQADIFRVLLYYAKEQQNHKFKQVILAAYGNKKFIIPGDYYQKLGQEFDTQNPMYTLRTFAHYVTTMNGERPFPEPAGGIIWVLSEEMRQFSEFNKQWYLNEYLARQK